MQKIQLYKYIRQNVLQISQITDLDCYSLKNKKGKGRWREKGEKTRISDITQLMNRRKEIFERQMFFGLIEGLEVRKRVGGGVCLCVTAVRRHCTDWYEI